MESLTEDLWAMVLARLPIKIFTGLKLVCKQWKSIIESPFFQNLFIFVHQNSRSSSWSLMSNSFYRPEEKIAHYQCDTWGLDRSLGSFVESFLADMKQKYKDRLVSVEAYSDAGLILIHIVESTDMDMERGVLYVANPVSRECIEIFHPIGFETNVSSWEWGLVTRTNKKGGHLLDYKVVKYYWDHGRLSYLILSSTGLWSLETIHLPNSFNSCYCVRPISLNGNLHWPGLNMDHHDVVVSINFYDTSTCVTPFPDLEKTTKFKRVCTPCQGFLHYMNIFSVTKVDGSIQDKLCVWRLMSEGYWQLMSEISPAFILTGGYDYLPLTINPLDAKTAYFWSRKKKRLLSINLHNGEFMIHNNQLEGRSDGPFKIPVKDPRAMISLKSRSDMEYMNGISYLLLHFVLPRWLYRIPKHG